MNIENIVKVNNVFDKVITKDTLTRPRTPSQWLDEIEYKNIMIIGLSYGGGIGGSYRKLYCNRINNIYDYLLAKQFIEVVLIDGKKEIINTRFLVNVNSNYQLMTTYLDNRNSNFEVGIHQFNYLVPNGRKVTLVNY